MMCLFEPSSRRMLLCLTYYEKNPLIVGKTHRVVPKETLGNDRKSENDKQIKCNLFRRGLRDIKMLLYGEYSSDWISSLNMTVLIS